MKYDFDKPTTRRGTHCVKWDTAASDDVIPMWIADMDFEVAPAIVKAVVERAKQGIYGYTLVEDDYYEAVISWFQRRHQWTIHRDEILYTTGVVPGVSVAIKALTMPGEQVVMLSPDYNCFFSSIRNNGCQVSESVLLRQGDSFVIDWDDLERRCAEEKTTVMLLCNPHNPTGRVWTKEELAHINDICLRHGVKIVSDEIHCELVMPSHRYQPFAAVSEACRQNCVVLNSPSKSFNIAGLQTANIVCANPEWRRRLVRAININEVCDLNPFGNVALMAAYNDSEDWIDQLNAYIWDNYQLLCQFVETHIPQWKVCRMEGTYLPWIDVTAGGEETEALCQRLLDKARVWLNPGTMYGLESGRGYVRINLACQRKRLEEALERISKNILKSKDKNI